MREKYFSIVARRRRSEVQQQQHVVGKVHSFMHTHIREIKLWHNALLSRKKEETGDGRWNAFLIGIFWVCVDVNATLIYALWFLYLIQAENLSLVQDMNFAVYGQVTFSAQAHLLYDTCSCRVNLQCLKYKGAL